MQTLRSIVVGTDFSDGADQALAAALVLASLGRARIVLVHVCALSAERGVPEAEVSQALDNELLIACHEALAHTIARNRHRGIEIVGVLRSGRPSEKLCNVAAEVGAGLIVIGRHGNGHTNGHGAASASGSLAERLMRTSSRPLLIVPGDVMRAVMTETP